MEFVTRIQITWKICGKAIAVRNNNSTKIKLMLFSRRKILYLRGEKEAMLSRVAGGASAFLIEIICKYVYNFNFFNGKNARKTTANFYTLEVQKAIF